MLVLTENKVYPLISDLDSTNQIVNRGYSNLRDSLPEKSLMIIHQEDIFEFDHQSLKSIFEFNQEYYSGINFYDSQFLSLQGISSEKFSVVFDGVLLNSSFDGYFDMNLLPFNFVDRAITIQNKPLTKYNFNDLSGGLIIESLESKLKKSNVGISGGNNYGSTYLNHCGSKGNIFWDTRLNYYVSNGYKASSYLPDSLKVIPENNDVQKISAFIKAGINDKNSSFSLSYLMNISNNNFSGFKKSQNLPIIKSIYYSMNILNINFITNLDKYLLFSGNLYYKSLNRNNEGIILENPNINSYPKIDEFGYGANFELKVLLENDNIITFDLNYRREKLNLIRLNKFEYDKYELEHLSLSASHNYQLSDYLDLSYSFGVLISNPLFADNKVPGASQNCYDGMFELVFHPLSQIDVTAYIVYNSSNPKMNYIFPAIIDTNLIISKYNYNTNRSYNISILYQYENFLEISACLTHSSIDNNYRTTIEDKNIVFSNYDNEFNKFAISAFSNLNYFNIRLNYSTFFDKIIQFENYDYQIFTQKKKIGIVLNQKYNSGLDWQIEFEYITKADYRNLNENKNYSIPDLKLLNIKTGQNIYKNYFLNIRINNILDESNFIYPGSPLPGFNYSAGVSILF